MVFEAFETKITESQATISTLKVGHDVMVKVSDPQSGHEKHWKMTNLSSKCCPLPNLFSVCVLMAIFAFGRSLIKCRSVSA